LQTCIPFDPADEIKQADQEYSVSELSEPSILTLFLLFS
jgi:hypothetical protein